MSINEKCPSTQWIPISRRVSCTSILKNNHASSSVDIKFKRRFARLYKNQTASKIKSSRCIYFVHWFVRAPGEICRALLFKSRCSIWNEGMGTESPNIQYSQGLLCFMTAANAIPVAAYLTQHGQSKGGGAPR